ncbi:MAG: STAS domain-containing protein [Planctomycetota bacterium]
MQITTETNGDLLEMRVSGRLDNEWAGALTAAIDESVRLGSHSVVLDLVGVNYISSAGIGSLVRAHKQFQSIRGFFGVGAASPEVAEVIRLTGLTKMLRCDPLRLRGSTTSSQSTMQPSFRVSAQAGMTYELYDVRPGSMLACEIVGDAMALPRDEYRAEQCQSIEFPCATMGLGLGAFGRDFDDCTNRFGEFLAVGGAAAQQPTNATAKPDFQRLFGDFVPSVQMLYGLKCVGEFSQLIRFERLDDECRLTLSSLADQFLTLADTDLAGMVFVAESAGLIGATLQRSPTSVNDAASAKLSHPEIRRWLSFTPERAFPHTLALVVGVAARGEPAGRAKSLAPLLRPLAPRSELHGHFHAAVFSYRPFKKRKLDLNETVAALLENEDLQAVLHLLHDDRAITGGGESEFVRGACWVGPIANVNGGCH